MLQHLYDREIYNKKVSLFTTEIPFCIQHIKHTIKLTMCEPELLLDFHFIITLAEADMQQEAA